VSSRSIGDLFPHLNLPSVSTTPATPSTSDITQPQCLFTPHQPSQQSQNPSSIPSSAWPHIQSLLRSHTASLPSQPFANLVETLRPSSLTSDASLEGVVLGLVFSPPENSAADKELRSLSHRKGRKGKGKRKGKKVGEKETQGTMDDEGNCLMQAIKHVEEARQMEGVLDIEGKGSVGFLVYRVD